MPCISAPEAVLHDSASVTAIMLGTTAALTSLTASRAAGPLNLCDSLLLKTCGHVCLSLERREREITRESVLVGIHRAQPQQWLCASHVGYPIPNYCLRYGGGAVCMSSGTVNALGCYMAAHLEGLNLVFVCVCCYLLRRATTADSEDETQDKSRT